VPAVHQGGCEPAHPDPNRSIDSGAGLSNATSQQRLSVPVRLFYEHLIEEGLHDSNPVGVQDRRDPGLPAGRHRRDRVCRGSAGQPDPGGEPEPRF
jgi:integrase/recombinase XerD